MNSPNVFQTNGYALICCLACTSTLMGFTISSSDLDNDGLVNGVDQGILLASWGPCSTPCAADLSGDGVVDGVDLILWMSPPSASEDVGSTDDADTIDAEDLYVDDGVIPDPASGPEPPGTSPSSGAGWNGGDGSGDPDPLDALTLHTVPLPAPVWLTLAGLTGAWLVRRRLTS